MNWYTIFKDEMYNHITPSAISAHRYGPSMYVAIFIDEEAVECIWLEPGFEAVGYAEACRYMVAKSEGRAKCLGCFYRKQEAD